jgi:hypothetical protein
MKISFIQNTLTKKLPKLKKIKPSDIESIKKADQVFSDCYLLTSMHALTQSKFGRKILNKNIRKATFQIPITKITKTPNNNLAPTTIDTYSFKFNDIYGKKEIYSITPKDYSKNFSIFTKQKNPLICSLEIAITKLVKKHFFKKPLICRMNFPFLYKNFEYNIPSNFLKIFTGIEPISIGEKSLNRTLKPYKEDVLELFKKMSNNPDNYSFIAGTGFKAFEKSKGWHCYTITDCNFKNKTITLQNKRSKKPTIMTFDEAIENLKFLTGYFDPKIRNCIY